MTDKVHKIKEWISKTQDGLMDDNGNFEYPEHEGAYDILCNLDAYIDSLQEEPVEPKVLEDMLNAKTAAESLGISQEEYDKIVDNLIYGKEPELVDVDDLPNKEEEPVSEGLEMAKELIENEETNIPVFYVNNIKDIFPELKESEDERIRKEIKQFIRSRGMHLAQSKVESWIAWLEKQGEQKPTWKPSDEQMNALNYVVNLMASSERPTENDLYYNILKSLRQQLNKLKE
jgi:hypothetical protein